MSQTHPTAAEILKLTNGKIGKFFHKSYLNLAKKEFYQKNNRQATLDDAQALRDIYEAQWYDYYIGKPLREKANRKVGIPIWQHGCKYHIDVRYELYRFLEFKYSTLITGKYRNTYREKSAGDLMKEMKIEFIETHIIENGLLSEWVEYVDANYKTMRKYFKTVYIDYSHLAYNDVTDDF